MYHICSSYCYVAIKEWFKVIPAVIVRGSGEHFPGHLLDFLPMAFGLASISHHPLWLWSMFNGLGIWANPYLTNGSCLSPSPHLGTSNCAHLCQSCNIFMAQTDPCRLTYGNWVHYQTADLCTLHATQCDTMLYIWFAVSRKSCAPACWSILCLWTKNPLSRPNHVHLCLNKFVSHTRSIILNNSVVLHHVSAIAPDLPSNQSFSKQLPNNSAS